MSDYLTPPPDWRYEALPWFAWDDMEELPRLVQVGATLLPEFFHLAIGNERMWGPARDEKPDDVMLFLNFQVFDGSIEMAEARSVPFDVGLVCAKVQKVVPASKWKSLGIHYMTRYLVTFMEDEGLPEEDPMAERRAWRHHADYRRPTAAVQWIERLQTHAADAYAIARDQPTPRRRRNRMTVEFLRQVAEQYTFAEDSDQPPTRWVADYFKTPHSTAAKWVATARRKGLLPPAESARNDAARAAVRPSVRLATEEEIKDLQERLGT